MEDDTALSELSHNYTFVGAKEIKHIAYRQDCSYASEADQ
jgi:hypothetical protein